MRRSWIVELFITSLLTSVALAETGSVKYVDDFSGSRNWWTGRGKGLSAKLENGQYVVDRAAEAGSWFAWCPRPLISDQWSDFEIGATLHWLQGVDNCGFGLMWGKMPERNYHYNFVLCANGNSGSQEVLPETRVSALPLQSRPAIRKGSAPNQVAIKKTGNWLHFCVNDTEVGKVHFKPFFGPFVGFEIGGRQKVAFDNFSVRTSDPNVPLGLCVVKRGSFASTCKWGKVSAPSNFSAELHRGADLRVVRSMKTDYVIATSAVELPDAKTAVSVGVYLETSDGGVLKLAREMGPQGATVVFATRSGGKPMGEKRIKMASRKFRLHLLRNRDTFTGKVTVDGKEQVLGALTWPKLSIEQEAGVIAEYRPAAENAPESINIRITGFYSGSRRK